MPPAGPVEAPDIRYQNGDVTLWPGTLGAHNWQPMSFSPRTGLVYIPTMQMNTRYSTKLSDTDFPYMGVGLSFVKGADPDDGKGWLLAWDPVAQKARWKVEHSAMWNGGTLATAGNLVFQGTTDGLFSAHDAVTGKRLWKFNAGLGIIGAPISWGKNGKQYVSVLVGWGGTSGAASDVLDVGWKYGQQPRRVLTFALGGKRKLAIAPGRDLKVHAVDDPSLVLDPAAVAKGRGLSFMCIACHGRNFKGGGAPGPDLREVPTGPVRRCALASGQRRGLARTRHADLQAPQPRTNSPAVVRDSRRSARSQSCQSEIVSVQPME